MHYLIFLIAAAGISTAPAIQHANESMAQAIQHALEDDDIEGVEVEVDGDRVTLTGEVESLWAKRRASRLALDHNHVDSVDNRVAIEQRGDDEQIARDIASRLANYVHYSIYDDVEVRVTNGTVMLDGKVTWAYKANEMEQLATRIPGVRAIENRIEVLPSSLNDQQIRTSIASRIYGDSMFWRYASRTNPPIHIIVDNGRVALTGVVLNHIEKRRAEIIAQDTFGVFSVDNQLRLESATSSQ